MKLSNFFKTQNSWTKKTSARNIDGQSINLNLYHPDISKERETRVESLSLYGALAFFFSQEKEPERREREAMKLKKAISLYTGKNFYIAEFNDLNNTSFEDIKNVIKLSETI